MYIYIYLYDELLACVVSKMNYNIKFQKKILRRKLFRT